VPQIRRGSMVPADQGRTGRQVAGDGTADSMGAAQGNRGSDLAGERAGQQAGVCKQPGLDNFRRRSCSEPDDAACFASGGGSARGRPRTHPNCPLQSGAGVPPETEPANITLTESRIAALKQLYLDEKITREQCVQGGRLLESQETLLDETDRKRLAEYIAVIDGKVAPDKLQKLLDLLATPEPPGPISPETKPVVGSDRDVRLANLLAVAKQNDSKQNGLTALAALTELLQMDPQNAEAQALRKKILDYKIPDPLVAPFGEATAKAAQQRWTQFINNKAEITNSIGMKFAVIPPGTFTMGTPATEAGHATSEGPQHQVTLTKPFYMGTTHVTVGQLRQFVQATGYRTDAEKNGGANFLDSTVGTKGHADGTRSPLGSWKNPGFAQKDDHPAVCISWNDAQAFTKWLSQKDKRTYRLPTEAEFEYCTRAGVLTAYAWGEKPDDGAGWLNGADLTVKDMNSRLKPFNFRDGYIYTSPVGTFRKNSFGLFDMNGNARQWCSDRWGSYSPQAATDPLGPDDNESMRILKGGSWFADVGYSRLGIRLPKAPSTPNNDFGFRCVLDLRPQGITAGLVHRYTFNDGTAIDSVGKAHGVLASGVTPSTKDGSLLFNGKGTAQRVTLPASGPDNASAININSFKAVTLQCWFTFASGVASDNTWGVLFSFGGTASNGTGYAYILGVARDGWSDGKTRAVIENSPPQTKAADYDPRPWESQAIGPKPITDTVKHLFTMTIDAKSISYYLDGVLQNTQPLRNTAAGPTALSGISNDHAYIGGSVWNRDPSFAGSIHDFSIYNRALSADEILTNFQAGPE
jgi:formylglycine-generating enzyme